MYGQRPTKLTLASIFELINGVFSLIGAALLIFILLNGGVIASLGRMPLTISALLFGIMGIVYVAFALGLWQRLSWARTGSFIAGALGILVGLVAPLPLISAVLNLVMIILLRDAEVREAFGAIEGPPVLSTKPEDLVAHQPGTTQDEWQPPTPAYQERNPVTYQPGSHREIEYQHPSRPSMEEPQMARSDKTLLLNREPEYLTWLIPTTGSYAGTEFPLRDVTTVGRDRENNISLDDEAISGRHLRIRRQDDQFILYDNATTNGTIVNGEKTLRHSLTDGDLIKVGSTTLLFMQVITPQSQKID